MLGGTSRATRNNVACTSRLVKLAKRHKVPRVSTSLFQFLTSLSSPCARTRVWVCVDLSRRNKNTRIPMIISIHCAEFPASRGLFSLFLSEVLNWLRNGLSDVERIGLSGTIVVSFSFIFFACLYAFDRFLVLAVNYVPYFATDFSFLMLLVVFVNSCVHTRALWHALRAKAASHPFKSSIVFIQIVGVFRRFNVIQ